MDIKSYIVSRLVGCYRTLFGSPVYACDQKGADKSALLIYLAEPLKWSNDDTRFDRHQNLRQSKQIAELLLSRGYRIKVVQYNDSKFCPAGDYDLVIAHSGLVANKLQKLPKNGLRICMRTGRHAAFVDRVTGERFALLEKRKRKALAWTKVGVDDDVYGTYDAIACFDANGTTAATFSQLGIPTYGFRNYANPKIQPVEDKEPNAKNGFLYLAGHLHVLKGLDWLIEIFAKKPELNLYIGGRVSEELKRIYMDELALPNIHMMGFVSLASAQFREICRKTAWYVSPSASEGCAGAVLDAMASGLIPIITTACGVNTHGVGFTLPNPDLNLFSDVIDVACGMQKEKITQQSHLAREIIQQYYRPEHFTEDWSQILDQMESLQSV